MTDTPRSFDHHEIAALPEYHAARDAIDALARAISRLDADALPEGFSQSRFVEAITDAALTSYAGDDCECCPDVARPVVWPHAGIVEDGGLLATYRCPRTGRTWTCGWTADPGMLGQMP